MADLLDAGGCYNYMRFALDEAGGATRNWVGDRDTNQSMTDAQQLILCVNYDGDDMDVATNATFRIQWRNISDAGAWTTLASTGELRWGTSSLQMTNNAALVAGERSDSVRVDCTGRGWTLYDATCREYVGVGSATVTVEDDILHEQHWLINLAFADSANADEYEFRVTESSGTVIGTGAGHLTVVIAGEIVGTTKNADRSAAVGGVTVTAYLSDAAGSNPKPTAAGFVTQVVSDVATGAYTLTTNIFSGSEYFLHFYKDDTNDLSDGSGPVTATAI